MNKKFNKDKKIKVIHLINTLAPSGKEVGIIKLLRHMDKSIFEKSLFVLKKISYFDEQAINNLDIICLDKKNGNDFTLPFKLASWFNKYKPDIVHTHSWNTLVEGILAAKISRIPIIIHGEHGTFPESILHRYIQRLFWKRSDLVLSVSEKLKDKLSRSVGFPPEKIQVILNGVEADKFYPSAELRESFRKRFSFSSTDFIIGTVGRIAPVKNHQMLIRTAVEVKNHGEAVHFVFIGFDEKEGELEKLANHLGVKKYIHFMGYQRDINLMMNGMDVFALTSFSEGCSNVIQEALFAGKPVIATNVGGNPELVKPDLNGYLVESDDHKELAQKILMLKKQPELVQNLGKNALSFSQANFSLKAMVDRYSELYIKAYQEKVLGSKALLS